jgi:predicted nucleic acid-binding protein
MKIFTDYRNGKLQLLAPDLLYAEFGNIIWKKQIFQGLGATTAEAVIKQFLQLHISTTSPQSLLEDAYKIASLHKRSVYDSLYLALSLQGQCQFVTADEKLVNAVGSVFPNIVWLPNWP